MSAEQMPVSGAPTPDEVRTAVTHIVVSDTFKRSPQLSAFLRYVVDALLNGHSGRIKGYTIGVEVLRRDINFDPQLDPIVRVEATRLRRTLERYYQGPGAADRVMIEIPLGTYVPTFRYRPGEDVVRQRGPGFSRWPDLAAYFNRRGPAGALALAALVALLVSIWSLYRTTGTTVSDNSLQSFVLTPMRPDNGMPTITVREFEIVGTPQTNSISAASLQNELRDAFSRFDAINVASATRQADEQGDYELTGNLDYLPDGDTRIRFRLIDRANGSQAWTREFDRLAPTSGTAPSQEEVVADTASILLDMFGVIRARDRVKYLSTNSGDPRYRCLLLTTDAMRSFDPGDLGRARSCLERLTSIDPNFGDGFAMLALVYVRQFQNDAGLNISLLDLAQRTVRRAIELNPASARAYEILGVLLFSRRDHAGGFAAFDKALSLNKYDRNILGQYGARLIYVGEVDRGMAILTQTAGAGDVRPSFEHFMLFLGNYLRGNAVEAANQANQIVGVTNAQGLLARALAAEVAGDHLKAKELYRQLIAFEPKWRDNPRSELEKFIAGPEVVDRLAKDLSAVRDKSESQSIR